jgi:hypothetical protein
MESGGVEERCHLNEVLKNRGVLLCFLGGGTLSSVNSEKKANLI